MNNKMQKIVENSSSNPSSPLSFGNAKYIAPASLSDKPKLLNSNNNDNNEEDLGEDYLNDMQIQP